MGFSESALVCVDETLTEMLRTIPPQKQSLAGVSIVRALLSPPWKGKVAQEQLKEVALKVKTRFGLDTPTDSLGFTGKKDKSLASSPIVSFRVTALDQLRKYTDKSSAQEAIKRAHRASAFRLQGTEGEKRCGRDFYRPFLEALGPCEVKPDSQPDETFDDLDIPVFQDYVTVFDRYPYVYCTTVGGAFSVIVGYQSYKQGGRLVRCNCKVTLPGERPKTFTGLVSEVGLLTRAQGNMHRYIKVLKPTRGMVIKTWKHIEGVGDDESRYKYLLFDGQSFAAYKSEEVALRAQEMMAKGKNPYLQTALDF